MRFVVTPSAQDQIDQIADFIATGNVDASDRYIETAFSSFFELSDEIMYRRASERLPDYIRELPVPGFRGYVLRVAYLEDKIGLIAAFRPGLTDGMKNRRTHKGLRELK